MSEYTPQCYCDDSHQTLNMEERLSDMKPEHLKQAELCDPAAVSLMVITSNASFVSLKVDEIEY